MGLWNRVRNALSPRRVEQEIEDEIETHLEEAGHEADFGGVLRYREQCRDTRVVQWLDWLRADTVFAWRQIVKRRTFAAIAILSLGLGIGASVSAFRLFDAGFLRKLPVNAPERLHFLRYTMPGIDGHDVSRDSFSYREYLAMQEAVKDKARLLMVSFADRQDISFGGPAEIEKVSRQYITGNGFGEFGLKPAAGRLFGVAEDRPGAETRIAVLTFDYAIRRFGSPGAALGRTFHYLGETYTVEGVIEEKFFGPSTGAVIDIYLPMHAARNLTVGRGAVEGRNARVLVYVSPGNEPGAVLGAIRAAFAREREAFVAQWDMGTEKAFANAFRSARVAMLSASNGISNFQRTYTMTIAILGGLAVAILLLACASVAHLLTIEGGARAREMALRISIGAGRGRLLRMLLVESLMLGSAAAAAGVLFAWWSAPFVVSRLNPPDNPVKLQLTMDARVVAFAVLLSIGVTVLFGLLPALRVSSTNPVSALREGSQAIVIGRPARAVVTLQVAFGVLVCFVGGLLGDSLRRLDGQELGFSPRGVLLVDVGAAAGPMSAARWRELAARVATLPGVESAAVSGWPLQNGGANVGEIRVGGRAAELRGPYWFSAGENWFDVMRIPMVSGRPFRAEEPAPVAIVNREFARHYFGGRDPVGETILAWKKPVTIVGMAGDIRMRDIRENVRPTVFFPPLELRHATLVLRLRDGVNPGSLPVAMRELVASGFPGIRVDTVALQQDLISSQTVRERLLAALAGFFSAVALILAGLGVYGALSHSVSRRGREIAIRMALGARASRLAGLIARDSAVALAGGCLLGLVAGRLAGRVLEPFLFEASASDPRLAAVAVAALFAAGLTAAAVPLLRTLRIDPCRTLRAG